MDIKNISFSKRPISIPPEYRPIFKISQITMILGYCCRSNRSNLLKLHLLSWVLKADSNANIVIKWINDGFKTELPVWGIEPTLNRGLQYAIAEDICQYEKGKYELTNRGKGLFIAINSDKELLYKEKIILEAIGKKISDDRITNLSKQWTLF
ncbi:hypothetical protein [Dysgonomonas sp.]|uniref:hypothetical protein n=1 Tax=Dysgonomonas sp. TaxID=1891233 RepID=UPI0027B8C230|nr:hypothetical protein [Dysgonomonas sp.]